MKSLICGLVILFGATVVWAQDICDEEVYEDVTVTAPDTAAPAPAAPAAPAASPTNPAAPSTRQGMTGETMREQREGQREQFREKDTMREQREGVREGGTAMDMRRDLIDTAITNGNLRTFVKALAAADLVATLKGQGPFTIFAPSDEAFAKLPAGVLEDLLKPENKSKLARILNNHVLRGQFTAAEVV